jgi:hypothetical protein
LSSLFLYYDSCVYDEYLHEWLGVYDQSALSNSLYVMNLPKFHKAVMMLST